MPCNNTHTRAVHGQQSYRVTFLVDWQVKLAPKEARRQQDKDPEAEGELTPSDQPSPGAAVGTAIGPGQAAKRQKNSFTG